VIHNGKEISAALLRNWQEVQQTIEGLSDEQFTRQAEGKWSAGQHLEHLLRSAQPLRKALTYPKFVIRLVAGKPNRATRSFDDVHQRYLEKIKQGGAASGKYIPPAVDISRKASLLRDYAKEGELMARNLDRNWDEQSLDNYLLPHPLLGKVTVREMMFFTVFHTEHHRNLILRDLKA
jgi:uncharacterized damage-inducible protein DinB